MYGETLEAFRLSMSALAMVARKSCQQQIYCKYLFSDRAFYVTFGDAGGT